MHDFNLSNQIVEQNKILRSKNYELDSRTHGLKNLLNHETFYRNTIQKQRKVDEIMLQLNQQEEKRKSYFAKNFTPITSYMKNLKDSKVTKDFGSSFMAFRANLNRS